MLEMNKIYQLDFELVDILLEVLIAVAKEDKENSI
jgi:hypothetical protein